MMKRGELPQINKGNACKWKRERDSDHKHSNITTHTHQKETKP
jgi:hypothetical protein